MSYRSISFSFLFITFFIAGCATSYHPENSRGYGFTEKQLSGQSYLVSFSGNSRTSPTDVQHMLLRRCAELTIQKGYSYFLILDKDSDTMRDVTYSEISKVHDHSESITKFVQIYLAHENDISPEGRKKAINAGIYLHK
ncbi:CC0125/CC1285 family lipoprotein [Gracilimonas sp. BCB1]|uniref:CC0125/CC1285 family lipoprotein n=1 Tax=Gracilimonas sp. BCB1 TaxID=3152362 RepID=UPI0032D8E20E